MENNYLNGVKSELTDYTQSLGEIGKLRLIGIISRILGMFLLIFTVVLCLLALFTFGAVAAIDALAAIMPVWAASLIVIGAYILLIILAILCHKPLFIHPFIALLTKQVVKTERDLELQTLEAEHKAQMQRVRMEAQVENATRELNFYVRLISRFWNFITAKLRK